MMRGAGVWGGQTKIDWSLGVSSAASAIVAPKLDAEQLVQSGRL